MRKPLVVANWKMNGSKAWVSTFLDRLKPACNGLKTEVVVCPPAVYLPQVAAGLAGSHIGCGAQDTSRWQGGAHTGEVSAVMLKDIGCHYVIVGHSERRSAHGETDDIVAEKYHQARTAGLQPLLCVGETLVEREAGKTLEVVARQLDAVLARLERATNIDLAYEPVWAIGTGRSATAAQAQEVHAFLRSRLGECGAASRIMYGGSVKAENANALFAEKDIDGALVGGASLDVEGFIAICRAAG